MLNPKSKLFKRYQMDWKKHSKLSSTIILFGVLVFTPISANASFEKALEIYSEGKYEEANKAFEAMAAIGDPSSLFNLGVMYFRGEFVEADPVKAYVLMKIANEATDNERLRKTQQAVLSRLDSEQKNAVTPLYEELIQIYGIKHIHRKILPQLLDDEDCPPELLPIKVFPPSYPRSEAKTGNMGIVQSDFTVSPEGYVREISITASTSKAFTVSTKKALKNYRYEPPVGALTREKRFVTIYQMEISAGSKIISKPMISELKSLREGANMGDPIAQFRYARGLNNFRRFADILPEENFQYREANQWFTRSARAGLANAQYEIGRNMMTGRGCKVDKENGYKWIKAAALGGLARAQKYLAKSELSNLASAEDRDRSLISLLRNAAQDEYQGFPAKVLLAWELVSSPEKSIWNPDEALELLEKTPVTYEDEVRILETQAAAWALKGNFKKAVKLQTKAQKEAKKLDWKIKLIDERLALYKTEQIYLGSYY